MASWMAKQRQMLFHQLREVYILNEKEYFFIKAKMKEEDNELYLSLKSVFQGVEKHAMKYFAPRVGKPTWTNTKESNDWIKQRYG